MIVPYHIPAKFTLQRFNETSFCLQGCWEQSHFITRNAVETWADRRVFPPLFRVLPNFHACFFNSLEAKKNIFPGSFRKCRDKRKNSSIKIKILFARAINTPTSRASSVFLWVNKHDSKPISNRTGIQENYVSQINYLPQSWASANNCSALHWQITIFCSTSCNNC